MAIADVTVMGAGVFGLGIAYECARRGARVQVIDPRGPGAGASGGVVGALAPHTPEGWNDKKAFQFDALIAARDFWPGVATVSGIPTGFGATGRLQPVPDAAALALAQARGLQAATLWQGQAEWRVIRADAGAWAPPSPTGLLIHDTLSARIAPRAACDSLAAALIAMGASIRRDGAPRGAVIWATGYEGLAAIGAGDGQKGQALVLAHDAGPDAPQIFVDGVHFIPHADGTLAVGSTSERNWDAPDTTDAQLDALHEHAVTLMPVLHGARVMRRWAGVRPRARTRAPILGPWPGRAGHFVANGGFKIGFGIAPGVARVMADLVLDGHDRIPPGFAPGAMALAPR